MTVWITGANGFIGRYLARELADAGHAVHGIGHGAIEDSEKQRLGLRTWLNGEIDAANLNALAAGHRIAVEDVSSGRRIVGRIIDRAALEDFSRTVASTARLLEWLRGAAPECRLIVASSAAVYGADHGGPISEDADAGSDVALWPAQADDGAIMPKLCRDASAFAAR